MNITWFMQEIDWEHDDRIVAGYFPIENDGTSVAEGVWAEEHGLFIIGIVLYGVFNGESITNWSWKGLEEWDGRNPQNKGLKQPFWVFWCFTCFGSNSFYIYRFWNFFWYCPRFDNFEIFLGGSFFVKSSYFGAFWGHIVRKVIHGPNEPY